MPTSYSPADEAVTGLLVDLMRKYRPDLHAAEVRVLVLMASTDTEGEPALKSRQVAVLADTRVIGDLWRAALGATGQVHDALVRIDAAAWADLPDAQHKSLLHHEMMHLTLAKCGQRSDGTWYWATDDRGRPRLKTRPGDLTPCDGFRAVIAHHGTSAHEYRQWTQANDEARRAAMGELSPDDLSPTT